MYDLKPDAPVEFRGEFKEIDTNVPGIRISEHLPREARIMDKLSVVRSVTHTNAGHGMGAHWMLTGYVPTIEINDNLNPSCGSVVAQMRGSNAPRLPAYVCLPNPPPSANAAYLGVACNPFTPGSDPNSPSFNVRDLKLAPRIDLGASRTAASCSRAWTTCAATSIPGAPPRATIGSITMPSTSSPATTAGAPSTSIRRSRVSAITMAGIPGAKAPSWPGASSRPASPT